MTTLKHQAKHVAFIMDGNRRFAKEQGLAPGKGHEKGLEVIENALFNWNIKELGVKEFTFYAMSIQNFKRVKTEVNFLLSLFRKMLDDFLGERLKVLEEKKIRIKFIGRKHMFNEKIQTLMKDLEEKTKENKELIANFALAYGGREEILDAVNKAITNKREKPFTMEEFSQELLLQSEPDLVIRTGKGNTRTSNFLIWQTWYSEWFFLEKFWPEFTKEDLITVLEQFQNRQRNFGK